MKGALIIFAVLLTGCATTLTPGAEQVRVADRAQVTGCQRMKLISVNQKLGPDKPGNAMKGALNEAAAAGGNTLVVISTSTDLVEGASVVAEAFLCK